MKGLPSQQNDNKRRRANNKRARHNAITTKASDQTTPRVKRRKSAYRKNRDAIIWEHLQKFSLGETSKKLWGDGACHPFFTKKARDKYLKNAAKRVEKPMLAAGKKAAATFFKHVFA